MTAPQDPRKHPLQDDEIALARVLRALPGAEPPARLDAAILAAATDAVAPSPRRRVRQLGWLPTWAVGTAAAAVLAVGVGMQLRPPLATQPLPQASMAERTTELPEARMSVELAEQMPEPIQPAAPPPPAAQPAQKSTPRALPPPPPPAPVVADAPPAPMAEAFPMEQADAAASGPAAVASDDAETTSLDTIEITGSRVRNEGADQARRAYQETYATRARERQLAELALAREQANRREAKREDLAQGGTLADAAMDSTPEAEATAGTAAASAAPPAADALAPPAPAPALSSVATPRAEPQASGEAGGDASQSGFTGRSRVDAPLPPVAADADLSPEDWRARIRERLARGQRADASASLRLYERTHPQAPVPDDLVPLR